MKVNLIGIYINEDKEQKSLSDINVKLSEVELLIALQTNCIDIFTETRYIGRYRIVDKYMTIKPTENLIELELDLID